MGVVRVRHEKRPDGSIATKIDAPPGVKTTDGSRVAVFEVMTVNPAIQNMIRDGRTHQIDNVIFGGNDKNMISMDAELQKLCREGKITRDSALLYAANPETLAKRI